MAVPTSASAGYTMPLFDWAAQQRSEPEPLHDGVGCSICGLVSSSRRQDATGRVVCEVRGSPIEELCAQHVPRSLRATFSMASCDHC